MRVAANSNDSVPNICEPTWQWNPRSSRDVCDKTCATAAAAAPLAIENPNFTSSWAVEIDSCVCASTPGVSRNITAWRIPCAVAAAATRSISKSESITIVFTPTATARSISATDLLLP